MEDRVRAQGDKPGAMGRPPFPPRGPPRKLDAVPDKPMRGSSAVGADDYLSLPDGDFSPTEWTAAFDEKTAVEVDGIAGSFRCYFSGNRDRKIALIFLHGGGQSALSWGVCCRLLKEQLKDSDVQLVAYDARGHGETTAIPEDDLSAERMVEDAVRLIHTLFSNRPESQQIILVGHSMGAAVATRVAIRTDLGIELQGLVNIDVVEGTAMEALPHMSAFLHQRPASFRTQNEAIKYMVTSGQLRKLESAKLSVPPQLRFEVEREVYGWRTDLEATGKHWKGWFKGMSELFLSVPVMKLLVLAGVDRLDKALMIAHMQGKFQNHVVPTAGHAVHEDEPEAVSQLLTSFLQRNRLLQ